MSKVFTGNCRDSMVLEVNSDICHNDVVVAALKGFDILSFRGDYKNLPHNSIGKKLGQHIYRLGTLIDIFIANVWDILA